MMQHEMKFGGDDSQGDKPDNKQAPTPTPQGGDDSQGDKPDDKD